MSDYIRGNLVPPRDAGGGGRGFSIRGAAAGTSSARTASAGDTRRLRRRVYDC